MKPSNTTCKTCGTKYDRVGLADDLLLKALSATPAKVDECIRLARKVLASYACPVCIVRGVQS